MESKHHPKTFETPWKIFVFPGEISTSFEYFYLKYPLQKSLDSEFVRKVNPRIEDNTHHYFFDKKSTKFYRVFPVSQGTSFFADNIVIGEGVFNNLFEQNSSYVVFGIWYCFLWQNQNLIDREMSLTFGELIDKVQNPVLKSILSQNKNIIMENKYIAVMNFKDVQVLKFKFNEFQQAISLKIVKIQEQIKQNKKLFPLIHEDDKYLDQLTGEALSVYLPSDFVHHILQKAKLTYNFDYYTKNKNKVISKVDDYYKPPVIKEEMKKINNKGVKSDNKAINSFFTIKKGN